MKTNKYVETVLSPFADAYTKPTFLRIVELFVGAIICNGRRTVTRIIAALGGQQTGDISDYHRVLSRAPWKYHALFLILAKLVLAVVPDDETVEVIFDDTGTHHKGDDVYGKCCHRDAVQSSRTHVVYYYGHKWVTMSILVKFPWIKRRQALPILSFLYISPKVVEQMRNDGIKTKYRTMPQLAAITIRKLAKSFPHRKFRFLGDGGYSSHRLASVCAETGERTSLVGKFYDDANLYEYPAKGRKAMKGAKMPSPAERVKTGNFRHATVKWYNSSSRNVKYKSGKGLWYRAGQGVVEVRWVYVEVDGHRPEYFFTTDMSMNEVEIIESYTGRWNVETTFEECKQHLGLDSTRNRTETSVLRSVPSLLAMYTLVMLIFHEFWKDHKEDWRERMDMKIGYCGYAKEDMTFGDVLSYIRRLNFEQLILNTLSRSRGFRFIRSALGKTLLSQLAQSS